MTLSDGTLYGTFCAAGFTADNQLSKRDQALREVLSRLVEFGHGCGAKVVAEGIETAEDAVALRNAGVDYGQGWHFARAGEISELRDVYPVEPTLSHERAA